MTLNRRSFLLGASSMLALPALATAQELKLLPGQQGRTSTEHLRPFTEIGNFTDDRDRLFMFFSYGCSFCSQYAPAIVQWSKTLPQPIQLVRVPIVTTEQVSQAAALAYYVVREIAPNRLDELDALAYPAAGKEWTADLFPNLLKRMNLPQAAVQAAIDKQITKDRMARAVLLAHRYKVSVTPHFGIGGRYATNANFTNGDYSTLVQLLNGLVSQVIASA